jgi:hypothetical protein
MTNSGSASGWEDLVATFMSAGVPVPPIPSLLKPHLVRREEWFWSTRDVDRAELYDPRLIEQEATSPVPDYVAIAHIGHGANSDFVTYQAVFGPVALFAQTGWGGVYMDNAVQTAHRPRSSDDRGGPRPRRFVAEVARLGHRFSWWRAPSRTSTSAPGWSSTDEATRFDLLRRTALRPPPCDEQRSDSNRAISRGRRPGNTVDVAIEMEWEEIGPVELVGGALVFPPNLPKQPGLIGFALSGPKGSACTGEASTCVAEEGTTGLAMQQVRRTSDCTMPCTSTATAGTSRWPLPSAAS